MTTETLTDLQAFNLYITERCGGTLNGHSLEEAVEEYREYQRQLDGLRAKVRKSEESAEQEGTRTLDDERLDELFEFWDNKLKAEGAIE